MTTEPTADERAVLTARAEAREAHERVITTISAMADSRQAFAQATAYREEAAVAEEEMALLRRVQLRRIRDDEALDLAALGTSLEPPMTKQRISKMIGRTRDNPVGSTPANTPLSDESAA